MAKTTIFHGKEYHWLKNISGSSAPKEIFNFKYDNPKMDIITFDPTNTNFYYLYGRGRE